jgi:hypothetical protein
MKICLLGLAIMLTGGCAASGGPPQLVRIAKPLFGGEAGFAGSVEVHRGCVVTMHNGRPQTVLFDSDVALVSDGTGFRDGSDGKIIRFGQEFRAGAAEIRRKGKGWSLKDIQAFFGAKLPENCPKDEVVRLHDFTPVN